MTRAVVITATPVAFGLMAMTAAYLDRGYSPIICMAWGSAIGLASLRTMFVVVTVIAIPLGWTAHSLNWIRQRAQFLQEERGYDPSSHYQKTLNVRKPTPAPGMLRLFGERGRREILVSPNDPDALRLARRLFPEAKVRIW